MFSYCENNPVMGVDPNGEFLDTVFDVVSLGMSIADVVKHPSDPWAWAGLAGDVIDLIPFVCGVGESVKGINATRKTLNAIDGATDSAKATKQLKTISGGACFVAGTEVLTKEGLCPIECIKVGDLVWATDCETGETTLKPVMQVFINEATELIHVGVAGEEIVCTNEHPFYSPVKGWTAACKLRAGDVLVTINGEYVVVEWVQHELLESPIKVYNFEVEDYHSYYVGNQSGVLVHNSCENIRQFTKDQTAVIQLAKEYKKTGISMDEAKILWEWADEYGLSTYKRANHMPKFDKYLNGTQLHIKINGIHINVT